jgi:hypothetical protein
MKSKRRTSVTEPSFTPLERILIRLLAAAWALDTTRDRDVLDRIITNLEGGPHATD